MTDRSVMICGGLVDDLTDPGHPGTMHVIRNDDGGKVRNDDMVTSST